MTVVFRLVRRCSRCGQTKPQDEAHFRVKTYPTRIQWESWCRVCEVEYGKQRYRIARGLPPDGELARGPRPFGEDGLRRCGHCRERLPAASFGCWTRKSTGKVSWRSFCQQCRYRIRRARTEQKRAGAPHMRRGPQPQVLSRACSRCGQTKPRASFEHLLSSGRRVLYARCAECRMRVAVPKPPTKARVIAPVPPNLRRQSHEHPCAMCGLPFSGKGANCKDCRRAIGDQNAVESEAKERMRNQSRVVNGSHLGLMWTSPHHVWGLDYLCQGCGKPIWMPGKCYSCATGRARTVLRPEERQAAGVAA